MTMNLTTILTTTTTMTNVRITQLKRRARSAFVLTLALVLSLLTVPSLSAATINVTFGFDFTGWTACSTTVTTNCLDHFEVGLVSGSTLKNPISIPLPPNPSGPVSGIAGSLQIVGQLGIQILGYITVGKDGGGSRITSNPLSVTASVTLSPPGPTNPAASVAP